MKLKPVTVLLALQFIACTKENNYNSTSVASSSNENITETTQLIPINDLRKNVYRGAMGGLYPDGKNVPSGTYADDLMKVCRNIVPTDTSGKPDANGKIVFISLGGSTGGHNMKLLKSKTDESSLTNSYLKLISCNNGSGEASISNIADPTSVYWDHVSQIIAGTKTGYQQVQIIYMETDDETTNVDWPTRPLMIKDEIETAMRTLRARFKNLKLLYVLGRTRTFNVSAVWNKEPSPYYFGWSCKWAIEDQINNVPGTEYKGKNAVAPMITWGFYQWADTMPRKTDGFYWLPSETADGLHANYSGQDTLTTHFQNFLLTDKYAKNWYAKH